MIFVDTVAWLYLFDTSQQDTRSKQAKAFVQSIHEAFCTSDLVIAETYKWLVRHGRPMQQAWRVLDKLARQEIVQILSLEQADRESALILVEKYSDQKLSYTDAITVAMVRRSGIKQVFSFDRHFLLFRDIQRVP